jgi:hypothetical protein
MGRLVTPGANPLQVPTAATVSAAGAGVVALAGPVL